MRRKEKPLIESDRMVRIARIIADGIIRIQTKWVKMMSRGANKMSIRTQKVVFIISGLIGVFCCAQLILNGVSSDFSKPDSLRPPQMIEDNTKINSNRPGEKSGSAIQKYSRAELDSILSNYKGTMDSFKIVTEEQLRRQNRE